VIYYPRNGGFCPLIFTTMTTQKASKPKFRKDKAPILGPNVQQFSDYISLAFDVAGLDLADYRALIIQHQELGIGYSMGQVNMHDHDADCFYSSAVAVFEDGVHWMQDLVEVEGEENNHRVSLLFNNEQTGGKAAIMLMTCILQEKPMHPPECQCCES